MNYLVGRLGVHLGVHRVVHWAVVPNLALYCGQKSGQRNKQVFDNTGYAYLSGVGLLL